MRTNFLYIAAALPAIILALSLHEFGHAAMATKMGDPTPRLQGRLTLNPLAHMDPLGTIFIIFTLFTGFGFGWGKPVQVNPAYYRNYRQGSILVAIAGPAMNLAQAMFALGIGYVLFRGGMAAGGFGVKLLAVYIMINFVLMIFNLLPIPPLDGGHLVEMMVPWEKRRSFERFSQYGMLILLGLMVFGVLGVIINIFYAIFAFLVQLGFGPDYLNFLISGLTG